MATIRLLFFSFVVRKTIYAVLFSNLSGLISAWRFFRTFYENWKQFSGPKLINDFFNFSANFTSSLVFINRITFDYFTPSLFHYYRLHEVATNNNCYLEIFESPFFISYCLSLFNEAQASFCFGESTLKEFLWLDFCVIVLTILHPRNGHVIRRLFESNLAPLISLMLARIVVKRTGKLHLCLKQVFNRDCTSWNLLRVHLFCYLLHGKQSCFLKRPTLLGRDERGRRS